MTVERPAMIARGLNARRMFSSAVQERLSSHAIHLFIGAVSLFRFPEVERLLMIFGGYFAPISDICFSGPAGDSAPTGADCAIARTHAMNQRANYYRCA